MATAESKTPAQRVWNLLADRGPLAARDIGLFLPSLSAAVIGLALTELQAAGRVVQGERGRWHISVQAVQEELACFLAQRQEPTGEGWPEVAEADVQALMRLCALIVSAKWGQDMDGDAPVELEVCDRTRQEPLPFVYPPRCGWDPDPVARYQAAQGAVQVLMYNLSVVHERLQLYWRLATDAQRASAAPIANDPGPTRCPEPESDTQ